MAKRSRWRLLALFMAMAMVLTLLPKGTTVRADDEVTEEKEEIEAAEVLDEPETEVEEEEEAEAEDMAPESGKFVIGWSQWPEGYPEAPTREEDFLDSQEKIYLAARFDWWFYFGEDATTPITVENMDQIEIKDSNGDKVDCLEPWANWENDEPEYPDEGIFCVYFPEMGSYTISYGGKTYDVEAGLPQSGYFTSTTFSEESYIASNGRTSLKMGEEHTFYFLIDKESVAEGETLGSIDVEFFGDVDFGLVKYEKIDDATYKFYVPVNEYNDFRIEARWSVKNSSGEIIRQDGSDCEFYMEKSGFVLSDGDWTDNGPRFRNNPDEYSKGWGCWIYNDVWICLGIISDGKLNPITDISKISVLKDGEPVEEGVFEISDIDPDPNAGGEKLENGLFIFRVSELGIYQIKYDEESVYFKVTLPDVAFYSSDKASQETLVVSSGNDVPYEGGKTYYIVAKDGLEEDEELKRLDITFSEDFKGLTGIDDYEDWDMNPIKITIPEGASGDFFDAIKMKASFENDWNSWDNEDRFNFTEKCEGLVITWPRFDGEDYSIPDNTDEYSKSVGFGATDHQDLVVGIMSEDGTVEALKWKDAQKIKVYTADGEEASGDIVTFEKGKVWNQEKGEAEPVDDLIGLTISKPGTYKLGYTLADNTVTYCSIDVTLPEVGVYSTDKIEEASFIHGSEVGFTSGKENVFFISKNLREDDHWRQELKAELILSDFGRAYISDEVKVEKADNGWKVTVSDSVLDPFEISLEGEMTEYEDNQKRNTWDWNRRFQFEPTADVSGDTVLVVSGPKWDDATEELSYPDYEWFARSERFSTYDTCTLVLGLKKNGTISNVEHKNAKYLKLYKDGEEVDPDKYEIETKELYGENAGKEYPESFYSFRINEPGTYELRYEKSKVKSHIRFTVNEPTMSAYKDDTVSEESFIGENVVYGPRTLGPVVEEFNIFINKFELVTNDNKREISNLEFESYKGEEPYEGVTFETTDNGAIVKIPKDCTDEFEVLVKYHFKEYRFEHEREEWETSWENDQDFVIHFEREKLLEGIFTDVTDSKAYFYEPVYWALNNAVTTGTTAITFSPENGCTRGQFVTFLWRAMGCPEPECDKFNFDDVKADKYYYKPVMWAAENGITTGTTDTTFTPDRICTREECVTFLYRAAEKPKVSEEDHANYKFDDVSDSTRYFYDPVIWAAKNKITKGVNSTQFGVGQTCTRGMLVTFLYRAFHIEEE